MSLKDVLEDHLREPRILTIDIEVSPAIVMSWGVHEQRISTDAVLEPSRMLCFAAKWLGDDEVLFFDERAGTNAMVDQAWLLLDEADVVVGYNHVSFDVKHLNREFVQAGLQPPSSWIDVDLLRVARKRFRFMSNKLGFVTDQLGLESKADSGGISTWQRVMENDQDAWARMEFYNRQDVEVTEQLFLFLFNWIDGLPHHGLFTGDMSSCPRCGESRLTPDGVDRSKVTAYIRFYCNGCGAYSRLLSNGQTRLVK